MKRRRRHSLTLPSSLWVVFCTRIILIPKLLHPLQEFQVILHLALHQPLDWDRLQVVTSMSAHILLVIA
jgi:hypothetical protein